MDAISIFSYSVIAICIIVSLVAVVKTKKKEGPSQKSASTSVKKTNVSRLGKENKVTPVGDTKELIDSIDDIVDGIVILDNYTRFVSAILCKGVNLYEMSLAEQNGVVDGYQRFINTIDAPITYRIYTKSVDISSTQNAYEKRLNEINEQISYASALLENARREKDKLKVESIESVLSQYTLQAKHLELQMQAMAYYSNGNVVSELTQAYIIEWKFDAGQYDSHRTKAQRFEIAKTELGHIGRGKISALRDSGVSGRIATQNEMIDMFRKQSMPMSSEEMPMRKIADSSYFHDITSSGTTDFIKSEMQITYNDIMRKISDPSILADIDTLFGDIYKGRKSYNEFRKEEAAEQ